MASLLEVLCGWCERYGADRTFFIAYSGGLDSRVLLHLAGLLSRTTPFQFHVIHIHHGLNPLADAWVQHCESTAKAEGLPFHCEYVQLSQVGGDSLEAEARTLRYRALASRMQPGDVMLTGHHQDDQAETLLLQLSRGAGVKGLSAMPAVKSLGEGWLVRPLLGVDRQTLLAYANAHDLSYINDDSNASVRFTRNFFRHEVLPVLKSRWPSITQSLSRSAAHCAESQALLTDLLADKLTAVKGAHANTLSVSALNALTPPLQKALIRAWIVEQGGSLPSTKKCESILTTMLKAGWDRRAEVRWGGVALRRHRDELHYCQEKPATEGFMATWTPEVSLHFPDGHRLAVTLVPGQGIHPRHQALTVRFRQGGEAIKLAGRKTHRLKALFQSWGVLPWLRDKVPLLFDGETLVGVVGYAVHADYEVGEGESGQVFSVEKPTD